MLLRRWSSLALVSASALAACDALPPAERAVLTGSSPVVALINEAAAERDVPAEIIAAVAYTETAFVSRREDEGEGHVPAQRGVMALPSSGAVRSIERGAELLGVSAETVATNERQNVRAAAAILRSLADRRFGAGELAASGSRDRWLLVVEDYFDAGAAGEQLALEVRRTAARGLVTQDERGLSIVIPSYAELYPEQAPGAVAKSRHGLAAEYPSATWVAASSGNYTNASRTGADIDVIVIHTVQGSYAGAISWFRNPSANVSAHYVVRRSDGAITQMVRHADVAWHAGNWRYNQRSIGIEHEGWVSDPNNYTDAMYRSSANLARWLCDTLGIPKDRGHIIAHIEVPGATHTDPGPHWDWSRYMSLINGGSGTPPPAAGMGTLKGVVYVGSDTGRRVGGARISVSPGGAAATARASDGYWEVALPAGTYTVTAQASGYADGSTTRTINAGAEVWGSVSVTPVSASTGVLTGVVYDARTGNMDTRIEGATVRLSNGTSQVVGATGLFEFDLPPGAYTISAEKEGWQMASLQRSVVAGQTEWGSVGLVPVTPMPENHPPGVPTLESPVGGVTSRSMAPTFTIDHLDDPDGDALVVEVEIYLDAALSMLASKGKVNVPARAQLASWRHPLDDMPRGATVHWRVRAIDAQNAAGPWTDAESFSLPPSESAPSATSEWTADVLPGVGTDRPPLAPTIESPANDAEVETTRPQILASAASDPEGDLLVYEVEVSTDDLFGRVEVRSPLVAEPSWVIDRDLAPGAVYYARVRAADERLFGPWSAVVSFTVSEEAALSGEEPPAHGVDLGGAPEISATVTTIDDGGCGCTTSETRSGAPAPVLVVFALFVVLRRRMR